MLFAKIIYSLFIHSYHAAIALFSFFNEKAYRFTTGRINQFVLQETEKTIWFHCASLGEFEQAKPLINWYYENQSLPIIITFFSPSGYVYKKNYPLAKAVYYLPKDSKENATRFIEKINPALAFFIKYDFWFYFLQDLHQKNIPTFLVSGIFRKNQMFFSSLGVLHKKMLSFFTHLFVQDENSIQLLNKIGLNNCSIAYDTRFDTVQQISELNFQNDIIEEFIGSKKCLVVGSSWQADEQIIKENITSLPNYKIIIAPHDINPSRLKQIKQTFSQCCFLSNPVDLDKATILIIDSVGKLSLLYRYATICYIGGAFGTSVHNVLEAAVYGKPILFGPNYLKSKEAIDLIKIRAALSFKDAEEFNAQLNYFTDDKHFNLASDNASNYVKKHIGGTKQIIQQINLG